MYGLVPTGQKVTNHTDYPDGEVERIIRAELKAAEIRTGLEITVRYSRKGSGAASGWWRSYWWLAGLPDGEYMDTEKMSARRTWWMFGVYMWRQDGEMPDLHETRLARI